MIVAWKGSEVDTDGVFRFLDANGDGHISRDEFVDLWADFWIGDDQASPSKWVFGPFSARGLAAHAVGASSAIASGGSSMATPARSASGSTSSG